jgi:hypothetical protein
MSNELKESAGTGLYKSAAALAIGRRRSPGIELEKAIILNEDRYI